MACPLAYAIVRGFVRWVNTTDVGENIADLFSVCFATALSILLSIKIAPTRIIGLVIGITYCIATTAFNCYMYWYIAEYLQALLYVAIGIVVAMVMIYIEIQNSKDNKMREQNIINKIKEI